MVASLTPAELQATTEKAQAEADMLQNRARELNKDNEQTLSLIAQYEEAMKSGNLNSAKIASGVAALGGVVALGYGAKALYNRVSKNHRKSAVEKAIKETTEIVAKQDKVIATYNGRIAQVQGFLSGVLTSVKNLPGNAATGVSTWWNGTEEEQAARKAKLNRSYKLKPTDKELKSAKMAIDNKKENGYRQ